MSEHKIEQKLALKRAEMAVADAEAKSGIAPEEIEYKKEIKSLKRRLTSMCWHPLARKLQREK